MFQWKHFKRCTQRTIQELIEFEELEMIRILQQKQFKVGILCWKSEHREEEDMLCNQECPPVC